MTATVVPKGRSGDFAIAGATEGGDPMEPEDIAPFAAYLASDYASGVNGQIFLVYGNTVTLMSQPRLANTIFKPEGFWSVEELRAQESLCEGLENPALASAPSS